MDGEGDDDNNIRVCVRIRPLNRDEIERGDTSVCTALSDFRSLRLMHFAESRRKWEAQTLKFDGVFGPEATQLDVFHRSGVEGFCEAASDGFTSTVFCFGQTGSGKTHTMTGPIHEEDPNAEEQMATVDQGIQFRAMHFFAKLLEDSRGQSPDGRPTLTVKAAMYEIYNEQVNDLLNETTNLKVRWSQTQQSFFVESLMLVQCDNLEDMLAVLEQGLSNRKRASHLLNRDSSRSHVVLALGFERESFDGSPPRLGKMNLVDLAGSEKLKDSGSTGENARETKNINQSLLALGKVISALAARSSEAFVPYRDSTLTRLLMDSLGGNAKTLMLACVTPSSRYADESIKTIRYAVRASSILNQAPTVRVDPKRLEVFELRSEIEALKKENTMLKERLAQYQQGGLPSRLPSLASTPTHETFASQPPQYAPPPVKPEPKYKPPFQHAPNDNTSQVAYPMQHQSTAFAPPATMTFAPTSNLQSQVNRPVALDDVRHQETELLRHEVNQLRNLILESRAHAIAVGSPTRKDHKTPGDANHTPVRDKSGAQSVEPQSNASEFVAQFGFRPAPKKSQRLGFLQGSNLSSQHAMEGTTMSAPHLQVPAFAGTVYSVASAPPGAPPREQLDDEVLRMNRQLEAAQRELLSFRQQGSPEKNKPKAKSVHRAER